MANQNLFAASRSVAPVADTVNNAGGRAYKLSDKGALAQMAVTGVFNDTFYVDAETQLAEAKALVGRVDPEFIAKLAVYAREKAFMKDMPAYLVATLAARDVGLMAKVFGRVIDNGKMLRNFVQIVRSGQVGRKSLGTRPKKMVSSWLNAANDGQLLAASVGDSPSLGDVIKLSHPKGGDATREAFYGYISGKKVEMGALPQVVRELEAFRKGESVAVPKVPFELLTSLPLSQADWKTIARNASWTQTRMNLNTFVRHGVFEDREMADLIAARLRNPELIAKAKVFPYQLLAAYLNVSSDVPAKVVNALQDAMEVAIANVPDFGVDTLVFTDVSGSMKDPVTGKRKGSTSKVRCVDVAGLFASAVLRRNENTTVVPFDTRVHQARLNSRDSIITNATKLAAFGGGGTTCSIALRDANEKKSRAKLVIYVSDNESWVDSIGGRSAYGYGGHARGTETMEQWKQYKRRVPDAKLVCIDINPNRTSQAKDGQDILNVGGFSDEVFNVVNRFVKGELGGSVWASEIEKVEL